MLKNGIFYATTSYSTEDVANKLQELLNDADVFNVQNGMEEILDYENIFILSPTYGRGELHEDFEDNLDYIKSLDLSGKNVYLIGLGDSYNYPDSFVNTIKTMYDIFKETKANIKGKTSTEGYEFEYSSAVEDDMFLGLPLDEMNEYDKTSERLENWLKEVYV